jgi:phosphopantetheinyl transferase
MFRTTTPAVRAIFVRFLVLFLVLLLILPLTTSLAFASGPYGKPALLEDAPGSASATYQASRHSSPAPRAERLAFSMSHSAATALYAFTRTGDVGVDVEVRRRPIDAVAIATRTFGPTEARRLEGLPPADREREFLRSWVRHEATLKYVGSGIGGPPGDGPKPWVADLGMDSGMAAAVAVAECPHELRCWEWPSRGASPSG